MNHQLPMPLRHSAGDHGEDPGRDQSYYQLPFLGEPNAHFSPAVGIDNPISADFHPQGYPGLSFSAYGHDVAYPSYNGSNDYTQSDFGTGTNTYSSFVNQNVYHLFHEYPEELQPDLGYFCSQDTQAQSIRGFTSNDDDVSVVPRIEFSFNAPSAEDSVSETGAQFSPQTNRPLETNSNGQSNDPDNGHLGHSQEMLPATQPQSHQHTGFMDPLPILEEVKKRLRDNSPRNPDILGGSALSVADPHWSKGISIGTYPYSEAGTSARSTLRQLAALPTSDCAVSSSSGKISKRCKACSITFDDAQHLRHHEKTFHGKSMFECACGLLDSRKDNYARHTHDDNYEKHNGFTCKCGQKHSTFAEHKEHVEGCKQKVGRKSRTSKQTSISAR